MEYSVLIHQIREDLLLTQMELAKELGVAYATVNRWENGRHEPTIKQKRAIRELCAKKKIRLNERKE